MLMDLCVVDKYRLGRKIGSGSRGDVYLGTHVETKEEVAVKFEATNCKQPRLINEAKIHKILAGGIGVPALHWYGVKGDFNVMVVELLGPSLQKLFVDCNSKFSLKTLVMLADQMINRIEYLHRKNLVHCDITPNVFRMGLGKKATQVHLIDFGSAKTYRNVATKQHIPQKEQEWGSISGAFEYLSLNAQRGVAQSRRDDLESLGYVLVHFNPGGLPWELVEPRDRKEWHQEVSALKRRTPVEELCQHIPDEFVTFLNYCRNLAFEAQPDYSKLRKLLKQIFTYEGYEYDLAFDWVELFTNQGYKYSTSMGRSSACSSASESKTCTPLPMADGEKRSVDTLAKRSVDTLAYSATIDSSTSSMPTFPAIEAVSESAGASVADESDVVSWSDQNAPNLNIRTLPPVLPRRPWQASQTRDRRRSLEHVS